MSNASTFGGGAAPCASAADAAAMQMFDRAAMSHGRDPDALHRGAILRRFTGSCRETGMDNMLVLRLWAASRQRAPSERAAPVRAATCATHRRPASNPSALQASQNK